MLFCVESHRHCGGVAEDSVRHKNVKKRRQRWGGGEGLCLRGESENVIVGMRVHVSAK